MLFDTPFTLSQVFSKISNLESPFPNLVSADVVSIVFFGDTRFGSKGLYHANGLRGLLCVASHLLVMHLDYNIPMYFVSFGSILMHVDGSHVVLVSSFAAIKGKLVIMLIPVNRVTAGFHYLMASFVELFLFRIFSLMWSELDGQASLVLQRSASWLMRSSTFVAVPREEKERVTEGSAVKLRSWMRMSLSRT
ncbi:hypothetical protein F2Q68_00043279 [Brassica cretica]|uniref:Uncharacterized protein n=1 Tax=Brassica cretica TaxID=69181 RepID=A0A8S9LKL4_BRACR|nr:hypothetical protein F2Q68_00043279 [Brassica cretica]